MKSLRRDQAYVAAAYLAAFVAGLAAIRLMDSTPLFEAAAADLIATLLVFAFGLRADNSSVYDPYWSVAPPLLVLFWLLSFEAAPISLWILWAIIVVWSVRLTANWVARWRGLDDEDWRYREFRARSGIWYWWVSFLAIHLFPTVSVFLGTLPVYYALDNQGSAVPSGLVGIGILIAGVAVSLESVADRQLREHRRENVDAPCRTGVWAIVRHPNYYGELGFWLGVFLTCFGLGAPVWTGAGFLVMCGIFFGYSIPAMDRHLAEKWDEYDRQPATGEE
jgi:steroid 5-alpha reductase family enzyme